MLPFAWIWLTLEVMGGQHATAELVLLWALLPLISIGSWRWGFVSYVEASPHGLTVYNGFSPVAIPWTTITNIRPGYFGLLIFRTDGRPKRAVAIQRMRVSKWVGDWTRADAIAELLMARVRAVNNAEKRLP